MIDLNIPRLGPAKIRSPLNLSTHVGDRVANFVPDDERVLRDILLSQLPAVGEEPPSFERAGPRELIYFDPSKLRVGLVTCGGLCPGTNNVIRSLVMTLYHRYGVRRIDGFQFGFAGLDPDAHHALIDLGPEGVSNIHRQGGTILGSSRGPRDAAVMTDTLERLGVGVLFVIGGDGSMRGALAIHEEVERRGLKLSVVGVPKTIDNDILLVEKTFGFETAFSIAIEAIRAANVEAKGAANGIGLVRIMGRHSGYIAATAALAEPVVNCVLIPEIPFRLDGEGGLLAWLRYRLRSRGHAVIVVAEGAGQNLVEGVGRDPSGNARLADVGLFLKGEISAALHRDGVSHSLKHIDPSYLIRSAPANPNDSLFCSTLAQNAVHAALSGRTGVVVGLWHNLFTHVPMGAVVVGRKVIDREGVLWRSVLESTGQPASWGA